MPVVIGRFSGMVMPTLASSDASSCGWELHVQNNTAPMALRTSRLSQYI